METFSGIVVDLDGTLAIRPEGGSYDDCAVNLEVADRMRYLHGTGVPIQIYTARNMRTFQGNIGRINAVTVPSVIAWLSRHNIPFDEVFVGKPWPGRSGIYVDDRAVRPNEFVRFSVEEVFDLVGRQ